MSCDQKEALQKTLLYSFFALNSFHFLFMYSDTFSTLFLFIAFYLSLSKKYFLSGIICLISMIIRQTNIVYMGFLYGFSIFNIYNLKKFEIKKFFVSTIKSPNLISWHFGFLMFIIYFIFNPKLSFGSGAISVFSPVLSLNNIYFLLFVHFLAQYRAVS